MHYDYTAYAIDEYGNLEITPYVPPRNVTVRTSLCGMWINTDTTLNRNITNCTGTIIYINNSDITLDCAGHYLETSGDYAINNTAHDNVTGRR